MTSSEMIVNGVFMALLFLLIMFTLVLVRISFLPISNFRAKIFERISIIWFLIMCSTLLTLRIKGGL